MNLETSSMKGFVFTLDAVFALVVAAVGVSIILYVDFTSPASYSSPPSQAYGILQSMLQTTISSISSSSGLLYVNYLAAASNAAASSWPQFGHDAQLSSGTTYSLQTPYLLYTFNTPAAMVPAAVADYGFVFVAAGNKIYMINASTGNLIATFPSGNPANVVGVPAVYRNMLLYANASMVVRGANIYNTLIQWNYTASSQITTPLEIENNYLAFGTSNGFYLLNILNGTLVAFASLPAQAQTPLYNNGEYIVSTTSQSSLNHIYSYALNGGVLTNVWNAILTSSATTQPVSVNNTVAVGSGTSLYEFSLGGSLIAQSTLSSAVLGIAGYSGRYYVQTSQNLYEFSNNGNKIASIGIAKTTQNATPSLGSSTLYAIASGNLFQGYTSTLSKMLWNMSLPYANLKSGYSDVALAYGNIYVPNGNTLFAFGTYKPKIDDNMLQALSNMYLNSQGDYSNLILGNLYNSSTTGMFINNSYAPDLAVATFNSLASSYIEQANGYPLMNNAMQHFSISIWVNPNLNNGAIVTELNQRGAGSWQDTFIELVNGNIYISFWNGVSAVCKSLGQIPLNSWSNIVMTYDGSNYKGYINGVLSGSGSQARAVPGGSAAMYYPLGFGVPTGSCGSGGGSASTFFSGSMLDYQIYNTTLSNQQASRIYQNGAFTLPIAMQNLTLWMPLDGNSNEFSGSFNTGLQYGITYTPTTYLPKRLINSYQISRAAVPIYLNKNGTTEIYNVSVVVWR